MSHGCIRAVLAAVLCAGMLTGCGMASMVMGPRLSAGECLRGANIQPGMTEAQVSKLMGKPYGMKFSRAGFTYMWMNKDRSHLVNIAFAPSTSQQVDSAVVEHVSGHCDDKSF